MTLHMPNKALHLAPTPSLRYSMSHQLGELSTETYKQIVGKLYTLLS